MGIMVATGTGIAPYRSFLKRLFVEQTPFGEAYKGLAWLFLGVANTDSLLYDDDWQEILKKYPDNFRLDYALSREQTNKAGGKMYIQDKVAEYSDEIFTRMDNGAHMYFCGLKGDAGHHRHAGGRLQGEGPQLGGEAQGVEEGWPVARRGLLSACPDTATSEERPRNIKAFGEPPLVRCIGPRGLVADVGCVARSVLFDRRRGLFSSLAGCLAGKK